MIGIIDYGAGNLGSIQNMLRKIGVPSVITSDPEQIASFNKLILPGVGSFQYGMNKLEESGLVNILNKKVLEEKVPILGICLGLQLMTSRSEEGDAKGLGWLDAETIRFRIDKTNSTLKVPHMGWNDTIVRRESKLFKDMYEEPRFYYVHSYHVHCEQPDHILTTAIYSYEFVSGMENGNIMGVQFHPEKSHKFGMKLLKNFTEHY